MTKWKGTTVPNSGYIEKVYFNTSLSIEEVVNELEKLTYVLTPFLSHPVSPLLFSENGSPVIFAVKGEYRGGIFYEINYSTDIINRVYEKVFSDSVGWKKDLCIINSSVIDIFSEIPVGTENDKISSLFSITQFEEIEEETTYEIGYLKSNKDEYFEYFEDVKQALIDKGLATEETPNEELSEIVKGISPLKKLLDTTKSCYYLFRNYDGTSVDDLISYDDTSNVTDMSGMFYKCSNLTSVPTFDTSNVTNMRSMFQSCSNLTTVPKFDTSNVNNMSGMFSTTCTSLKSILMYGMKVSFDISVSTKFERSDLVTILNNLATVTTTQTLTMRIANLAKLTNEDKEIAIAKGWTLA